MRAQMGALCNGARLAPESQAGKEALQRSGGIYPGFARVPGA